MIPLMNKPLKTALVTGSSKRVGAEIVRRLANDGWQVAIHCNRSRDDAAYLAAELSGKGVKAFTIQQDLSGAWAVERVITETAATLGPISLLIHNASLFERDALESLTEDSWNQHMSVNLLAPMLLTRAFVAQAPKHSSVICLLDGMRGWSVSPAFFSYAMSRMGMENFITLMAESLSPDIRINGILLGPTMPGHQDKPGTFSKLGELLPLKRVSSPREVCDAIAYLLAAEGTTGQCLDLTGGMNIQRHHKAE